MAPLTSISLLFLIIALSDMANAATQPPTISFRVTVRDFMPQPCRLGVTPLFTVTAQYCPNDTTIQAMVLNGTISGHPDFERTASPTLYPAVMSAIRPYNGTYATFGKQFPLTPANTPNGAYPYVLSTLSYGATGIPRMRFCEGSEGYICDSTQPAPTGFLVMNESTFTTWYSDSQFYNIRSGFKLPLTLTTDQYKFDSSVDMPNGFYDPIQHFNLAGWPLSNLEKIVFGSKKFWFTTEIHGSFQYNGGEVFTFTGDDDVHVFINNRLALNLGGVHAKLALSINLTKYEAELGLEIGKIYQFDLFHAERQTTQSNFGILTTLSEACNVATSDLRSNGDDVVTAVDWTESGNTNNSNFVVIGGSGYGYFEEPNKTVVLMKESIPNVVSYMFFSQKLHVDSGFAFSFKFRMTGVGHGFAVLIHNRQLGLQGFDSLGTGYNQGIVDMENSYAIVFDMCPNYPRDCNSKGQLRIHYALAGERLNNMIGSTRSVLDPMVIQDWRDGSAHTVEVFYYANPDWVEVYVDNSLRLVERGFSMKAVLGGPDAFVGFSSASSDASTMDVRLYDVALKTVKVSAQSTSSDEDSGTFPKIFHADGVDSVSFTIQTGDVCQRPVRFGGYSNLVDGRMVATSSGASGRRLDANILTPEIIDLNNGKYSVSFTTNVVETYDAYVSFGSNCSWNGTAFTANDDCFVLEWPNAAESTTAAPTSMAPSHSPTHSAPSAAPSHVPSQSPTPPTTRSPSGSPTRSPTKRNGSATVGIEAVFAVLALCGSIVLLFVE